ncbi:MAG: hypothetical protein CVU51_03800 [Deltaproteobacteria bacterium HGW-Deltaproteobacteria-1]|jgi:hypothetical protein|nr:MAG: hypothetical protein CVU51_03800 [Deltaproteobacteria bacterium HGW-Deltaproteobacteria-1]
MNKISLKIPFTLLFVLCFGCMDNPSERAKEFLKNAYTGKDMQPEDWLTKSGQSSQLFNSFGGLNALVKNCLDDAKRNNGLKAIKIINVTRQDKLTLVETEIFFNNNTSTNSINAWVKEDGRWKMTPNERNEDK